MKKLIFALLIISQIPLFAQPKLKVENNSQVAWGRVKPNDSPLKADVKLYNIGDQTLEFLSVKPGCSCTAAPLDKMKLAPGDSTTMHVTLNVKNYNGKKIHKTIKIITNESENTIKYVDLNALVINSFTFFPSDYFKLGLMVIGEDITSKIIITNETKKDIKITGVVVSPPESKINLKKNTIIKAGEDYEITCTFRPLITGQFIANVIVSTNDKDMPKFTLRGKGSVVSEYKGELDK